MVDCSQFLDGYSDFRDETLDAATYQRFELHLLECAGCARYHRVVCRGVEVFREIPPLAPAPDFLPRLQHRLFHLKDELGEFGTRSSPASLLLVAAVASVLAFSAWLPVLRSQSIAPVPLPPVAAVAPQPPQLPAVFRAGPLLMPAPPAPAYRPELGRQASSTVFFRYSPLGASAVAEAVPAVYHP